MILYLVKASTKKQNKLKQQPNKKHLQEWVNSAKLYET